MNKRFRMISLTAEALSIELEDVIARDKIYEDDFKKDFAEEVRYLMLQEDKSRREENIGPANHKNLDDTLESLSSKVDQPKILKELYRALAKSTHPDIAGPDAEEEFKQIQGAYTDKDLITLMSAANRNNVSANIDDNDLRELQKMLESQRQEIKRYKETVRWIWGESDKNQQLRNSIIASLGIDPLKYYMWKEQEKIENMQRIKRKKAVEKKKQLEKQRKKTEERKRRIRETQSQVRNPIRLRDLKKAKKKKSSPST